MRELKIGDRITIECVRRRGVCQGCAMYDLDDCSCIQCDGEVRSDGCDVKFVEVQVHTFTDDELEKLKEEVTERIIARAWRWIEQYRNMDIAWSLYDMKTHFRKTLKESK